MRIGIVGCGGIGSYLAARLAIAGHEVAVAARPEYVHALRTNGLRVRLGRNMLAPRVAIVDRIVDAPDLLLMAVKTQDLAQACHEHVRIARGATLVTLQNGLRAESIAGSIVGTEVVVGAIAMCAVNCAQPGAADVEVPGWLIVGHPSNQRNDRVALVATALGQGMPTFVTRNFAGARWTKLIGNLVNGLSAATGFSFAELARNPLGRRIAIQVMREGHRVAHAAKVRLDRHIYGLQTPDRRLALLTLMQTFAPGLPLTILAGMLSVGARTSLAKREFRGSTWQSLARGKRTEIDYLNGEIVRLGSCLGVDTPLNLRVLEAVHASERSGRVIALRELCPHEA